MSSTSGIGNRPGPLPPPTELKNQGIGSDVGTKDVTDASTVEGSGDSYGVTIGDNGELSFTRAALLPPVAGPFSEAETVAARAEWLDSMGDAALMFTALMEMARTSRQDMQDAKKLKNALHTNKISAKDSQTEALEEQLGAERGAALNGLRDSVIQLGVQAAVSFVSSSQAADAKVDMDAATPGSEAQASASSSYQAWTAAGQTADSLGKMANQLGQAHSKVAGAGREVDEKRLEGKRWERQEAILDDGIDSAKSSEAEAREQFKLSLRILTEYFERKSQVAQKISNT